MATGISLHIGLNEVDEGHYGSKFQLDGCENDALAMDAIARVAGFSKVTTLLREQALSQTVLDAIDYAATTLKANDIFFLSFSGHGGLVDNGPGPADEPVDQAWALYDRFLIDDELYEKWTAFNPGVRIIVLSDSCFSGTITSFLQYKLGIEAIPQDVLDSPPGKVRAIPLDVAAEIYRRHYDLYSEIQLGLVDIHDEPVDASVLLIAACQEWQLALDQKPHGLFTQALLDVWQDGRFPSDYEVLWEATANEVIGANPQQTPKWFPLGRPNVAFYRSRPFKI